MLDYGQNAAAGRRGRRAVTDTAKDWVRSNAVRFGDAAALENAETGELLSWRQVDGRVGALAGYLRDQCGVGIGDRVLLLAEGDTRDRKSVV